MSDAPRYRGHRSDDSFGFSDEPYGSSPAESTGRRRRSVEEGGLSVSDLVAKHTGSRPNLPAGPQLPPSQSQVSQPQPPQSRPSQSHSAQNPPPSQPGFPQSLAARPQSIRQSPPKPAQALSRNPNPLATPGGYPGDRRGSRQPIPPARPIAQPQQPATNRRLPNQPPLPAGPQQSTPAQQPVPAPLPPPRPAARRPLPPQRPTQQSQELVPRPQPARFEQQPQRTPQPSTQAPRPPQPPARPEPERRENVEKAALTAELEVVSEHVQRRRQVDETLARFSAVHDELAREEKERTSRRQKYMPWLGSDEDAPVIDEPAEQEEFDPEDDFSPEELERKRHKRELIAMVAKVAAIAIAAVVLIACGIAWGAIRNVNDQVKQVNALELNSPAIRNADKQRADENFLLVDSDAVVVAHIPANRQRIVVVSFPGYLEVAKPTCTQGGLSESQNTQSSTSNKVELNSIYPAGGPQCVTEAVQQLSGLRINHFLSVGQQGLKTLVDSIGPENICTGQPSSGDALGRVKRQQQLLSSLFNKVLSTQTLQNPTKITDLISSIAKDTQVDNVDVDQVVSLAQSVQSVTPGQVLFTALPTSETAEKALFNAIIDNTSLPGKTQPATQQTTQLLDPKTVKIQVLNGGNPRDHIAAATADALHSKGFQPVLVATTDKVDQTTIKYSPSHDAAAQTVAAAVPGAKLVPDHGMGGAIALILGSEFTGKITQVEPGKSVPKAPTPAEALNTTPISAANASCP